MTKKEKIESDLRAIDTMLNIIILSSSFAAVMFILASLYKIFS